MCRPRAIGYQERELDRDVLADVAAVLFPAAELVDIRGWGESLLLADIDNIIRLVAAYQARCRVVTNLSFSRPATLDLLIDHNAMIDVSLDTADQEVLDDCRPGAKFSLIRRNLSRMVARLAACGESTDSLRLMATLQSNTLATLDGLVAFAAEVGVRQVVFNEVTLEAGDPKAVTDMQAQVDAAVERARRVANDLGVDLYAGGTLTAPTSGVWG